jgi:Spy/CpxP family protein refolding chaperone
MVAAVVAAMAVATVVVMVAAAEAVASVADQRPDPQQSPLQEGSFYSSSRI